MEKDITIAVHIEEDEATTTVHTVLDLMGDLQGHCNLGEAGDATTLTEAIDTGIDQNNSGFVC